MFPLLRIRNTGTSAAIFSNSESAASFSTRIGALSWCSSEAGLQDGCPLGNWYFFEANLLPAAVPWNCLSPVRPYIFNPGHLLSERRY